MELNLKGKTVFISGSGQGIGQGIAGAFLKEGASVFVNDISSERLTETHRKFTKEYGDSIITVEGDLTKEDDIDSCIKKVLKTCGKIDILISNLGTGKSSPGLAADIETWRKLYEINLFAAVKLVRAVVPVMKKQKNGNIVFTSSIAGLEYFGAPIAYSAAKAGLLVLSKNMAHELAEFNIRVNVVAPGNIKFPGGRWEEIIKENQGVLETIKKEVAMKRFGTPEEIANCVVFLASEKASFVTGTCLIADGGQTKSFF
jgi:3-oxoacyl-[acyl-carrier protein] reductase